MPPLLERSRTPCGGNSQPDDTVSTTTSIDARPVSEYVGVVTGEAVLGANVFRDLFAGLRDIVGDRSAGCERSLRHARETAIEEMVAEAGQLGAALILLRTHPRESIRLPFREYKHT